MLLPSSRAAGELKSVPESHPSLFFFCHVLLLW